MSLTLTGLTGKDQFRFQQAIGSTRIGGTTPLAAWSFPAHYIWRDVLTYSWTEMEGWLCLFAQYADGIFMPLPPLGPQPDTAASASPTLQRVLRQVMEWMDRRNQGSAVTRIENIPEELKDTLEPWGYRLTPKDSDYLYATPDVIALQGNRYKSQRAACNRFLKSHRFRLGPYRLADREHCLALFQRWLRQKEQTPVLTQKTHEDIARLMLRDAAKAHRRVLNDYRTLGLTGRVLWVDGSIRAYTFGYPRTRDVFCILLEVADRSVYGLAQYLFREFCREFRHYPYINTMDDSGLPDLARAKQAYHPCQLVRNFILQTH